MNRLIIIGNGFDRAHNLATRYKDFIEHYLFETISDATCKNAYDNTLFTVWLQPDREKVTEDDIRKTVQLLLEKGCLNQEKLNFKTVNYEFFFTPFLQKILRSCNVRTWVDIENEYYKALVSNFTSISGYKKNYIDDVESLNVLFEHLIGKLESYLSTLKVAYQDPFLYRDVFCGPFDWKDFNHNKIEQGELPKEILLLNFNYTQTPNPYLKYSRDLPIEVINIHGQLNSKRNPIIFGFGDELDENYQQMERINENEYFRFIKSFWYLLTDNYKKVLNFINSEPFEVRLFGHSCGLSDRTLLSTIFANDNCRSVKPFYWGNSEDNNYTDIIHNLSRHFESKERFRDLVVNREDCRAMYQLK